MGVCTVSPDMMGRERVILPTDTKSWQSVLDGNGYGILLFAMRNGLISPNREAILNAMNDGRKKNAVYAAAVAGYDEAIEPLISVLEQPEDIHKNPAIPASIEMSDEAVAVFLLGEMKCTKALPILKKKRVNPLKCITADDGIKDNLLFDMENLLDSAIAKIIAK